MAPVYLIFCRFIDDYIHHTLLLIALLAVPAISNGQCGITIPTGAHCSPPDTIGLQNCYFFVCDSSGGCINSGLPVPRGTKCGLFGDECFDDFCDGQGACLFSFNIAPANQKCASDNNVCDGLLHCDGLSGLGCAGDTTYPAAACDDGVFCTEDCNPIDTCVTYPFHVRCDDSDICTVDICDTTGTPGCVNNCISSASCATGSPCFSFPVELLNFWANVEGKHLYLEWMTAVEVNNEGFEIQLSTDAVSFQSVGFLAGAGTVSEAQFYQYSTTILAYGVNYIRLKQIDISGDFIYTKAISVFAKAPRYVELSQAYPNPTNNQATINFSVYQKMHVGLELFDQNGKMVITLFEGKVEADQLYSVRVNVEDLTPGMYFYRLVGDIQTTTKKLTVY